MTRKPYHSKDSWFYKQEVASTYETWYEGKYQKAETQEKDLIKILIDDLEGIESILEVGCGTTRFTRWFTSLGLKATGCDISPAMLGIAKTLFHEGLVQAGSAYLPFASNSFDVVAFITCFEYMPTPEKVLADAARVARKGIIMGMMNKYSIPTTRRRIQVFFGKNPYYQTAHFYSPWELESMIKPSLTEYLPQLRWKTTVFPQFLGIRNSSLPFGAFLGLSVRLHKPVP